MIYLIVCAAIVFVDQMFKNWIVLNIEPYTYRGLLPGVLSLTNVKNYGAAFSILQHMRWVFIAATVLFIAMALWAYFTKKVTYPLGLLSLAFVLGGAIGNCIDRLRYGYVVDMLNFEFMDFAIFNIADSFICVGSLIFCIYLFFLYEKKEPIGLQVKGGNGKD